MVLPFLGFRFGEEHVLPIALMIPVVTVLMVVYFSYKKRALNFPPCTPDSVYSNAVRGGFVSLPHKVEMSEWVADRTRQNVSRGATFRLSMPTPFCFFTTADWALSRLILAGDPAKNVKECDKSPSIKNINIFPSIDSILTAETSRSDREKTRKFIAPSFSTGNLQKTTIEVMRRKSLELLSILDARIGDGKGNGKGNGKGKPKSATAASAVIDMKEINVNMIFEVLTESLFDMKVGHKTTTVVSDGTSRSVDVSDGSSASAEDLVDFDCDAFLEAQNATMKEAMVQARNPLRKYVPSFLSPTRAFAMKSRDKLISLGRSVLKRYRQTHPTVDTKSDHSIIGHLVAHDYPSEEHRISDLLVFLIAGHETTAHSLSFFLYCMAKNPKKCAKLQAELDAKVPANEFISPSDVAQLEYFGFCLKESQRLYPVAPVVGRKVDRDIIHNGFLIPDGSVVAVHLWAMARQRWINEASAFLPERWADDNPQLDSLKQMPTLFSMGKRSCIGQNLAMLELRALACMLLRNFDFSLEEEPEFELFVTVKPVSLKMNVSRRT